MSDSAVFADTLESIDLLSYVESGVETEVYQVDDPVRAFPYVMQTVADYVRNSAFTTNRRIALFDPVWTDSVDGLIYLEEWNTDTTSLDHLFRSDKDIQNYITDKFDQRKRTLRNEYGITDDWLVLVDHYDPTSGTGDCGQSQYVAYDATCFELR